ncbi:hypothetical protein K2173_009968 [Erythroxylum novogranatense]|uniref:Uncharacterized protein n=1 Tax=Erythroxylum novogranatense TaxID=1862640 RepID=A0AAV8SZG4_9ROSI|nr:hypothetical protein K2173_009968 [Erythroxylum novogranatense]
MSWLRSAVNKAVQVGNKNNLTRAVRNYADSVVQHAGQAVAEGAKILQDRIGNRSFRSVKQTVKRLEEAAVSCRGSERVTLLKRWLVVLKEVEKFVASSAEDKRKSLEEHFVNDDGKDSPKRSAVVLYFDSDVGGEPMNFRDVFFKILEPPTEEEISLLLVMFRKEVHNAIVSSIQDLATAFARYQDEVLVKREELLQFVQGAITGLKISAEFSRIDAEASNLRNKLDEISGSQKPLDEGQEKTSDETSEDAIQVLRKALAQIRICSKLEGLLLRKKNLNSGDSPEIHAQKIDKLKVLSESLANSMKKSEKRILDSRLQKEEALKVRVTKADEANEKEKEISAEIAGLEKERDELEAQLKKVNISLAAANARLRNAREEIDQFDEANNQILEHLTTKEDELSKSISACKIEADVLSTWINFLEDSWTLQRYATENKEKQVNDELGRHEEYFTNLAIQLLSDYKKELEPSVTRIGKYVENLKQLSEGSGMASSAENEDSKVLNPRKNLEEEYLGYEAKIIAIFSVVDNMKEQFYASQEASSRKDDMCIKELFEDIGKLRVEFDSIERPDLDVEMPSPKAEIASEKSVGSSSNQPMEDPATMGKSESDDDPKASAVEVQSVLDHAAELAKLESEIGKVGRDYSGEEIGDWEFDELERELRSGDAAASK